MAILRNDKNINCQKPLLTKTSTSLKLTGKTFTHRRPNCIHKNNRYKTKIPHITIPGTIASVRLLSLLLSTWRKGFCQSRKKAYKNKEKIKNTNIFIKISAEMIRASH